MPKEIRVKSSKVSVATDIKRGTVTLSFECERQDVEITMRAFDALDVGLKILAGTKMLIDVLLEWANTKEETIQ